MFNQINYSLFYLIFPILFPYLNSDVIGVDMDRNGCGETKGCLFRPNGCAIVFTISGRNQLYIQMTAQSLYPPPSLQYIAIGFSHDKQMGDDFVSECVLSPDGSVFSDVEVYPSYNLARSSNERTLLSPKEHSLLYGNLEGKVENGRLYCSFTQAIRPQFSLLSQNRSNLIWNLDKSFWVMGATGSAQPDEINAHETTRGSHYYPILSSHSIDVSNIGLKHYNLPVQYETKKENETPKKINETTISSINLGIKNSNENYFVLLIPLLIVTFFLKNLF